MKHTTLYTLAVSLVAGTTLMAQPPAAAPAQPAIAPAPVAAANPDDAAARSLLTECASAVNKVGPFTAKLGYGMLNAPQMNMKGDVEIAYIRNAANPAESLFKARGAFEMPMVTDPRVDVAYLDGMRVQWVDEKAKAVFDRPYGPGPDGKTEIDGVRMMGYVRKSILMPAFAMPAPFSEELRQNVAGGDVIKFEMKFLPDATIGDAECTVVHVIMKAGAAERKVWIGKKDKLPRRYEQWRGGIARFWEVTSFKTAEITGKDLAIKVPDGYRFDKSDVGGMPRTDPAYNPNPQPGQTPGGPQIGQFAPEWELKTAAGETVTLASMKGQPVLLTFGGSMFPGSWNWQKSIAEAATGAAAGKALRVVSLSCRDNSPESAGKAFDGTGPLVVGADTAASLYNVRGFPSAVLISAEGKVEAFFEGVTAPSDIAAAVVKMLNPVK